MGTDQGEQGQTHLHHLKKIEEGIGDTVEDPAPPNMTPTERTITEATEEEGIPEKNQNTPDSDHRVTQVQEQEEQKKK